jgi:hypothetical protein
MAGKAKTMAAVSKSAAVVGDFFGPGDAAPLTLARLIPPTPDRVRESRSCPLRPRVARRAQVRTRLDRVGQLMQNLVICERTKMEGRSEIPNVSKTGSKPHRADKPDALFTRVC